MNEIIYNFVSAQNSTPTLWAGTNNGTVFAFTLHVPNSNKRKEDPVSLFTNAIFFFKNLPLHSCSIFEKKYQLIIMNI